MNMNGILTGSEDPQRLADYYTALFGEPGWNEDGYVGWMIGSGGVTVGPHDQVHGQNPEPGRVIWNVSTPDVQGEFDRLVAAGATVVKEPYSAGDGDMQAWICTFADPDGNYFQLMSPMD
jgi:predicted enzyme related to lactoylglutathione lyase